ncbi:MAG: HEAT repeat domain-containing protein, partial [Planctomycetes bacterium]|nr:HEAT repeat domain-containing protein [Planctomycetota bacterium]
VPTPLAESNPSKPEPIPDHPRTTEHFPDPVAQPVEPRPESANEQRAREVAAQQHALAGAAESGQFDKLLDLAKQILADGGAEALLWAPCPQQTGSGNDEDLRRLVAEYGKETDPARLWALAQRIHHHLTYPRGTIWTVDLEACETFAKWATEGEDPLKRGFALAASGTNARNPLLFDPDFRVRGTAAGLLPAPKGISASDAAPVADSYRELLNSTDPNIRAAAAKGFGPWAFRPEDVDALIHAAQSDSSELVRANAARSLATNGSDRAKEALTAIAKDLAQPDAVREAARIGMRESGIVPEGLESIRVLSRDR